MPASLCDIQLIMQIIAPWMAAINIVLLLIAAYFLTTRSFSKPRTIEEFTGSGYAKELENISRNLSGLDEDDSEYHQKLRENTANAVAQIINSFRDQNYWVKDEIKRSRIGLVLTIIATFIQTIYLLVPGA